jgi:hypothetical protein
VSVRQGFMMRNMERTRTLNVYKGINAEIVKYLTISRGS